MIAGTGTLANGLDACLRNVFESAIVPTMTPHLPTPNESALLFAGLLSDVMDSIGLFGQVAEGSFYLSDSTQRVTGHARTARAIHVTSPPDHPYELLLSAIDALGRDDVLVLGTEDGAGSALFGGLLATAVSESGGAGVIVDGFIRDSDELGRIGLPTAFRGRSPLDSFGRDEVVEAGTQVSIGGVLVHQGDFVLCDIDGLAVVPAEQVGRVISLALRKLDGEQKMRKALQGGMSADAAFKKFGLL